MSRWFTEGDWAGEYTFDLPGYNEAVPFRMQIRLGWLGFIRGTVRDESEKGTPDEGTISGRISANGRISFVKRIPFQYIIIVDPVSKRVLDGRPRLVDGRHPPIYYSGEFDIESNRLTGTWNLQGQWLVTGKWSARSVRSQKAK